MLSIRENGHGDIALMSYGEVDSSKEMGWGYHRGVEIVQTDLSLILLDCSLCIENDKGVLVDLYIPRHCSATGRLITANDHASIQIQVADVDADGKAIKGQGQTIAICGRIRAQGDSDDSINRIATKQGLLKNVWSYTR
ncbi:uncharacterized protein L199_003796 [Kwoniella botswanensis]|uniref:uncharacterized protein n=1 Tax=Kwoniella botswanensis TaxID=1268659 RepID=UPI00315DC21B